MLELEETIKNSKEMKFCDEVEERFNGYVKKMEENARAYAEE